MFRYLPFKALKARRSMKFRYQISQVELSAPKSIINRVHPFIIDILVKIILYIFFWQDHKGRLRAIQ